MKTNKQTTVILCLFALLFLPLNIYAQVYPNTFIIFRDTVYMQDKDMTETMRLYKAAKEDTGKVFTGTELYLMLSRCEYLMGISFRAAGKNNESAAFFEHGIARAEESLAISPTSEGYRLLGTNISFLCEVRPSFGLMNFTKIETYAKKALELDPNNLTAQYLIAAFYIIAPWPFLDLRKGTALLGEITKQDYYALEKEDLFNLYLMLELACLKQKKTAEALVWHEKAAGLYSSNNFISLLVK